MLNLFNRNTVNTIKDIKKTLFIHIKNFIKNLLSITHLSVPISASHIVSVNFFGSEDIYVREGESQSIT